MVLRNCRDSGHSGRPWTEPGRRRRHRAAPTRVIAWPLEQRAGSPPLTTPDLASMAPPRWPTPLTASQTEPLAGLSWLWQLLGQSPAAREQWSALLRLAATSAERPARAETLNAIGSFASATGDPATAHTFFQEALIAGRAGQDAASVARSLEGLAQIAATRGAFDLARALQEECLVIQRRLGATADVARSLALLGWLTLESAGTAQSVALHEESLALRVTLGEPLALAYSLVHLGWLDHLLGRRDSARQHLAEALATVRACPDRWKVVALLALLGRPSPAETPAGHAIRLLTAAEALEAPATILAEGADDPLGHQVEVRGHLDARALAVVWGGGREVDAGSLVDQALREAAPEPLRPLHTGGVQAGEPMPLTPRELEVAMLISRGYTNRQIADQLVIAERTAETHARNIREKLGLTTRAQIAAWAATHVGTAALEPTRPR